MSSKNFKYLDELIHSGVHEIVLDSNIILTETEASEYLEGIKLDVDGLVIDGNGHYIDACEKTRIFHCSAEGIALKNITLKNANTESNGGAIYNKGDLTITDSAFSNNTGNGIFSGGAICNWEGRIRISRSSFTGNVANGRYNGGGAIYSLLGEVIIKQSSFTDNRTNGSQSNGAALYNKKGIMKLADVEFQTNIVRDDTSNDLYNDEGVILLNAGLSSNPQIVNRGFVITSGDVSDCIENFHKITELKQLDESQRDFTYLNDLIQSCGDEIRLNHDIILDISNDEDEAFKNGIVIDRNDLTIDGGGHTIDAGRLARIFRCTAKNVTIKNVTLKNGVTLENGGAVHNLGELTMECCRLTQNASWNASGAIHNEGKLMIMESVFSENKSYSREGKAGAILNKQELTIKRSSFKNNMVTGSIEGLGGALYNEGNLNIDKSEFTDNHAKSAGGALFNLARLHITRSVIKENTSHGGGAICGYNGDLTITESEISANEAGTGGAIYANKGKITIIESVFKENKSGNDGGAIKNSSGELTVIKSRFNNNTTVTSGGAIYNHDGKLVMRDSKLCENSSSGSYYNDGYGAAVCSAGEAYIMGCRFAKNITHRGGAVTNKGRMILKKSSLNENTADLGGGIFNASNMVCEIHDCDISSNTAKKDAGAIYTDGNLKIFGCEILENESPDSTISNCESLLIKGTDIKFNKSKHLIWNNRVLKQDRQDCLRINEPQARLRISNTKIIDNEIEKSVLINHAKVCNIEYCIFKNNLSSEGGLNIENTGDLTLKGTEIDDDGKTVSNMGYVLLVKSFDIEGKICGNGMVEVAERIYGRHDFGYLDRLIHETPAGEIALDCDISFGKYEFDSYCRGIELDVDGLVIDGRGHTIDGLDNARIFIVKAKHVTLKNIIFKNAHPLSDYDSLENDFGGALMVSSGAGAKVIDCRFINNISKTGGAINSDGELLLKDCVFDGNMALFHGAALNNNKGKTRVLNCLFIKNSVISDNLINSRFSHLLEKGGGGAINNFAEMEITGATFTGNNSRLGGAVNNEAVMTIAKSGFSKNRAIKFPGGGAIRNDGRLKLIESVLEKNESGIHGGAVFNEKESVMKIISCEIKGNSSKYGGAVSNMGDANLAESTINENGADKGGAINNTGQITIIKSEINDNTSFEGKVLCNREEGRMTIEKSEIDGKYIESDELEAPDDEDDKSYSLKDLFG